MTIPAGSRLGPYEILAPIGAGGMGEVYRAKDPRLGRDVAIKVLPSSFSADPDRLRRFEQEARAAGRLNHPNITAVLDIGEQGGTPYFVQELIDGVTLRQVLVNGKLSPRRAVEYATQIAQGLAAAHENGIVHRDLKPTNLMVTRDGRIKVLDFGLARLIDPADENRMSGSTKTLDTEPGVLLGTVGYMSPEQVRGDVADARSDIFSLGAVLYEMLTGVRAFRGDTKSEVMTAILRESPPDLLAINPSLSGGVERIVWHCLEKNSEQRFQSARDLAFDLEGLSLLSGSSQASEATASHKGSARTPRTYRRLTFRRGTIVVARFAPDTHTIVSCARWEGAPLETHVIRRESPESRPLGLPEARLLAVSSAGEMAVALRVVRTARGGRSPGVLARMPLGGGAPRELLENVSWADWTPDGSSMAVVRDVGGRERLDFPIGSPVYEPHGWVGFPRVSPDGDSVAFIDYSGVGGSTGVIAVVNRQGRVDRVSQMSHDAQGLAWSPSGDEIWFTASSPGTARALRAITLQGRERLVERVPGDLHLHDISSNGGVLVSHEAKRYGILCRTPGQASERELSWFDYSVCPALSDDGKTVLFAEGGEGGGPLSSSYVRGTDGSAAIRLGDGAALALSPDGRWALAQSASPERLLLLPTGPGESRELVHDGFTHHEVAAWFPDGKHILFSATREGERLRSYVQDIEGSVARPVTPEGTLAYAVSRDGRSFASGDLVPRLYSIDGGDPVPIPGVVAGDVPVRWHEDGRSLFVRSGFLPASLFRVDTKTGDRQLALELMPSDPSDIIFIGSISLTPDASSYAYGYTWIRSNLFVVEGLT